MSLMRIANMTEDQAREYIESIRWPDGVQCSHCVSNEVYKLKGVSTRPGLYKCSSCRKQFTVTVGTVMHRSHITLKQWLLAFHLMCSSKKGVSASQLQRELDLKSYKSAWFLAHRIRAAMEESSLGSMLSGTVEVDETYVGGRKRGSRRGRGTQKTPVIALISRDDDKCISKPMERVTGKALKGTVRSLVAYESRIMTDEWKGYTGIGEYYTSGHSTVMHSWGEYSRGDVHVNNAESFFAILKRGIHGIFHHVSKKHLARYCHEFAFRWTHRKIEDNERAMAAIKGSGSKRLYYRKPLGSGKLALIYD